MVRSVGEEALVTVAARNVYPQPDKPESAWAKLQDARQALASWNPVEAEEG